MQVPNEVVILTPPDEPDPTTALIIFGAKIMNDAAFVPPKLTAVAELKFWPVTVTVSPVAAKLGVKEKITGGPANINPFNCPVP